MSKLQTVQKPVNYQLVAITIIAVVLVAGIWIFGFDDELFGTKPIRQDSNTQQTPEKPIPEPIEQKVSIENQQAKPDPEPTDKPVIQSEQKPVIHAANKDSNPISLLENAKFKLDVDGTAYEGALSLAKPAEITLSLIPIKGTKLEKFDVSDGKIVIGTTAISFDRGTAEIKGTAISISVINDDSLDPFFTIVGTLDDSILSDKDSTQNVSFSDQLVYFGKKDEATPHHFDVSGELKH